MTADAVVAIVEPLLAGVVLVVALIALGVWYGVRGRSGAPPPPEVTEEPPPPPPPEQRDETWDPRERYGD